MPEYKIVRFFSDARPSETVKIVSSLEAAKLHCSDAKSSGTLPGGVKWFDGFEEVK